jgi:HD superfamily phosphohydrolase
VDKSKRDSSGNPLAECYIAIKPNAVTAYEQVLLSRKQMFDQVYTHRLNSSFDSMVEKIIDYLIPRHIISPPQTYREFIAMRDSTIEAEIEKLACSMTDDVAIVRCAQMLISRTPLVRLHETIVPLHKLEKEKHRLEKEYSSRGRVVVAKSALKEFTKAARDDVRAKSDIWRVEPESDSIGPVHITNASELLSSTVYRNTNARLVVFKTDEESAQERKLANRIALAAPAQVVERVCGKSSQTS